jgi:cytokinin dehydrogenase
MMPTRHAPVVDGEFRRDEPVLAAAGDDFGHIVHRTPHAVVVPVSEQDVAAAVRWAGERGLRFAAQGRRHSVFGRGQVAGGVVADMTRLRAVHAVRDDRVDVDAGASWREVLAATLPHGRTVPGLPDYLDLSVGGTFAVGGVGATISRTGALSDNVLDLRVVTGRGELIACSPHENAALFDAVRAGLGQAGVVTRATLRLVPAPRQVRRHQLFYPDLATLLADQRRMVADDRFTAVQGAVLAAPTGGWTFRLDAILEFSDGTPDDEALLAALSDDRVRAQAATLPYLDHLDRLAALERALRANGQWAFPHPWLMTFVGDPQVESVVDAELARLTLEDLGPFGQVVVSAFHRGAVTTPLLRLPDDELCYAVNLVRIPATDDPALAQRLVAANRAVYRRVRAAGGTQYPVSALPMTADDWHAHFGPAFDRLRAAKLTFDPDTVLTPGYQVF